MRSMILILAALLFHSAAGAQAAYSKTDREAILRQRTLASRALKTADRPALYRAGLFFEVIYDRYKDTSIRAAIRLYTAAFQTEGDLHEGEAMKAARRLGAIYEKGKGVPADPARAYAAYFMAGKDNADQKRVQALLCTLDEVLLSSLHGEGRSELVIGFHPACRRFGDSTQLALSKLADVMRADPDKKLRLRMQMPDSPLTHFMNYYARTTSWSAQSNPLLAYLVEVEGISADRLLWNPEYDTEGSSYRISMQLEQ